MLVYYSHYNTGFLYSVSKKKDLERKLSAIVKAEESLFTTQSCEEQLKLKASIYELDLSLGVYVTYPSL